MTVDLAKLPSSAFVDSGAFMVGMGLWPLDSRRQACVEFLRAMFQTGRPVGISVLSLAEWMRHGAGRDDFPRIEGLEPRAFDYACAKALMNHLHMRALVDLRGDPNVEQKTAAHWKFDTLIVATGIVWLSADPGGAFVSVDGGQLSMARSAGLTARHPDEYQTTQTTLFDGDGDL